MFEVVKAIHRAIPVKYGDLVTRTSVGPRGHLTRDEIRLASRSPHVLNEKMRGELLNELQRSGFRAELEESTDIENRRHQSGAILVSKSRRHYVISLHPEKEFGEEDIKLFPNPKQKQRRFGFLERKLFSYRLKKLLNSKRI